jgi:hypothetical protein
MLAVLAAHLTRSDPMQITIDQFHELVRGVQVALTPPLQKTRDLVRIAAFLHVWPSQL